MQTTERSGASEPAGPLPDGDATDRPIALRPVWLLLCVWLLFFISGAPALVYQMTWQRILALHTGVGLYSVAMIVAIFMAGLGVGSHLGGLLSRRLSPHGALRCFAGLELGIAAFGAISGPLYYEVLYRRAPWLYDTAWEAAIGHTLALLPPTCLMGMSLPVLVRAMVTRVDLAGRTIGALYGVNVLGAAVGAAITPWVLIRQWGVTGAILCGVTLNLLVGISAWLLTFASSVPAAPQSARVTAAATTPGSRLPFPLWVALYALCGFTGLALEMLWFRICDVAAKSTAFTFGTVLAAYLLGIGAGSLAGVALLPWIRQPLRAFLLCQCGILTYSAGGLVVLTALPSDGYGLTWLMAYWRTYDGLMPGQSPLSELLTLYVAFPLALFGVPTVLMGVSFCVLQRAVQDAVPDCGYKVGILQAANIAGCVAGALVVGLWLLTALGTTGTMQVLAVLGVVLAAGGYRTTGGAAFPLLALTLIGFAASLPDQDGLWLRLHGMTPDQYHLSLVEEDATGVVALTPEAGWGLRMSVDGKGHSWLPYRSIHSYLGCLPAVVHPAPRRIAIIGLGSGDTAWAAACRPDTERVDVFELCAPEQRLLQTIADSGQAPQVSQFLSDRRVRIHVADGRNALARTWERYDIIEADASRPNSAYAGNLYSVEYFQLCSDRLASGGIMCAWAPTPRVYATFCQVFPHVLEVNGGEILLGSRIPLKPDIGVWTARLSTPDVADYLGRSLMQEMLQFIRSARPADRDRYRLLPNRDLYPRDEFLTPSEDAARRPLDRSRSGQNSAHLPRRLPCDGSIDKAGRYCVRARKSMGFQCAFGRDGCYGGSETAHHRLPWVSRGPIPLSPQPLSHRIHAD